MIDAKKLEEIAKQISDSVPPGVKNVAEGLESKVRQILQAQLSKLDFVSREEFDVQTQVLIRTREKVELLEQRLDALEQNQSSQSD